MDKLGRVWNRLSTRRIPQFPSNSHATDEDNEKGIPPDTKKEVFALFSKTTTHRQHRPSAISTNSAVGESSEEHHRSGSYSKKRSVPIAVPTTSRGSISRHQSSSPRRYLEVNVSSLPASTSLSSSLGTSSMISASPIMTTTTVTPATSAQHTLATQKSAALNSLAIREVTEGTSSEVAPSNRSPLPPTRALHTTFAPMTTFTENTEVAANSISHVNETTNRHSEDTHAKPIQKDSHVCTGSVAATSAIDFKEHTKRRNSMFVKRGSVSIEPVKRVNLDDVYDVFKQLGTGRFGSIKLAQHKESRCKIAIKFFPRPQTKQVDFVREYNYSFFLSPHPNIIDTYEGMYQAADESAFFFVQEICPCASLREAVESSQNGLGESATRAVMSQLLAAIEFMHSENLVHRNLKAENVLIFDSKDFSKVKVTDFGLTRKVDSTVRYLEYVNNYHAPELCETVVNEVLIVSRSTDIWAIGIIFYYCLKGRFPWQKATIMCKPYWEWEQWLKRKNPLLPKRFDPFSEKSLKLLKRTLNPRHKDRWSAKDVRKCILKEKLLKSQKLSDHDYNYYPRIPNSVGSSAEPTKQQRKKKSAIHQWISSTLSTMAEISEQVVSARDE
ncbi:Putative serine/threonine-protein kinase C01C4.3 [Toxocara canis]|uniref:Putative serine/threonine-protein kinase C01C4.3 n=2 Tax=Toxocara canis TaxID=6265 RepID=A0A0B2UVY3_TOXCA|nr:Putative serine/threonine-protein kinase C01C4.3 [Toxocara canis]VDM44433.1 unnamed protein product [Toxocara canis]